GAEEFGAADRCRVPVEDHSIVAADDDRIARFGSGLEQGVLDSEPFEPVGQIADGFVVAEVRLLHPPAGFVSEHPEQRPVGIEFAAVTEPATIDGLRTENNPMKDRFALPTTYAFG